MLTCDGTTESGVHVRVEHEDEGVGYGKFTVEINKKEQTVKNILRYRDGGTTVLELEHFKIRFPHKINDPDRTPRLVFGNITEKIQTKEERMRERLIPLGRLLDALNTAENDPKEAAGDYAQIARWIEKRFT